MSRQPWKVISINVMPDEYESLRLMASVNNLSLSGFVRKLLNKELEEGKLLRKMIEKGRSTPGCVNN